MNNIAEELRRIADICDCGDKPHWATAMRAGAMQISIWQPEIERLRAEVKSLRKDAERYRWLRTAGAWESEIGMDVLSQSPDLFDAAVDAAMEE